MKYTEYIIPDLKMNSVSTMKYTDYIIPDLSTYIVGIDKYMVHNNRSEYKNSECTEVH